jgi:hypothetical protein
MPDGNREVNKEATASEERFITFSLHHSEFR